MKTQYISQPIIQYNGVGSKYSFAKDVSFGNQIGESSDNTQQEPSHTLLSPLKRISIYTTPPIVKTAIKELKENEPPHKDTVDMMDEVNKKREEANNLLAKLGINGMVTTSSIETVPQNCTMHYIETSDKNASNMVMIEFENGEYIFAETSLNSDDLFHLFDKFRDNNEFNKIKFSVEELKDLFLKFFDSLKEL